MRTVNSFVGAIRPLVQAAVQALGVLLAVAVFTWPTANAAPADQAFSTAASVVFQLQGALAGVSLLADLTPETDPDHLLGLQGRYVARAAFTDSSWATRPGQVTGFVEVFAFKRDMASRLDAVTQRPYRGERDLTSGTVLLRLIGVPDDSVSLYADALQLIATS